MPWLGFDGTSLYLNSNWDGLLQGRVGTNRLWRFVLAVACSARGGSLGLLAAAAARGIDSSPCCRGRKWSRMPEVALQSTAARRTSKSTNYKQSGGRKPRAHLRQVRARMRAVITEQDIRVER
jgi:hypothetical protein